VNAEEMGIWAELTAPHNFASVQRYVANEKQRKISDYATLLYETILAEASHRWENDSPGSSPAQWEQ